MPEMELTGEIILMAAQSQSALEPQQIERSPHAHLVAAVRAGDESAFGQLYRIYGPMVHGLLLARVPHDDAADIAQDVFFHAYRKISTLRDDNAFGGWLAMIARNRAVDFHRRSRETSELPEDLPRRREAINEAREILDVIRCLPDAYRETLVLRLVEGLSGPEIAELTGLTPASVRVNLHRGMKLLRERLEVEVKR